MDAINAGGIAFSAAEDLRLARQPLTTTSDSSDASNVRAEMRAFSSRCRNPIFAARAAADLIGKVANSAARRFRRPQTYYPPEVRAAFDAYARQSAREPSLAAVGTVHEAPAGPGRLQLATGQMAFTGTPDWDADFEDIEETQSLHRWNWLLTSLAEEPLQERRQRGLALVRSWLEQLGCPTTYSAREWNSYSTGERVANLGLFWLQCTGSEERRAGLPEDLHAAVCSMARHLASRLEYNGQEATGNHPFNNARALFVAGQLVRDQLLSTLAFTVMRERLATLVTADGFLREGSSHYHFLFTRWVLEIIWIAETTGHRVVREYLQPVAARLVERCWFFIVSGGDGQWTMALFGDVSPDFPPPWLLSLPWSPLALRAWCPAPLPPPPLGRGWADLWGTLAQPAARAGPVGTSSAPQSFPASHWYRIDAHGTTLFVRAESDPGVRYAGHRHGDLGGFVLCIRGTALLIDCGRLNYRFDDPMGQYGISGRAHNAVLVDGCEAQATLEISRLPSFYRANNAAVSVDQRETETMVTLRHDGFSRIPGETILHTRRWGISPGRVRIEDLLEGCRTHHVETRFHWAPCVHVESAKQGLALQWGEGTGCGHFSREQPADGMGTVASEIVRGQTARANGGWCSPSYGSAEECTTVIYTETGQLPMRRRHLLEFPLE